MAADLPASGPPVPAGESSWLQQYWWMALGAALAAILFILVGLPVLGLIVSSLSVTGLPGQRTFTLALSDGAR